MIFPTTDILDNFDRANQNPIAGNWSGPIFSGDAQLELNSNRLDPNGNTWADSYWNVGTYYNSEIFCTVATTGGSLELALRIVTPGTSGVDCYFLDISGSTWSIWKAINGAQSQISSNATQAISVGDKVRFAAYENLLIASYFNGTEWVKIVSVNDSSITDPGYIGVVLNNSRAVDDVGGGQSVYSHIGFDTTPDGSSAQEAIGKDFPFGNVFTVEEDGQIGGAVAYLDNPLGSNGDQDVRIVIYPASGGAPINGGACLAASREVIIPRVSVGQWWGFDFPTPLEVSAGDEILIGLWAGNFTQGAARAYYVGTQIDYYTGILTYNSVSLPGNWGSGGTSGSSNSSIALYAVEQVTAASGTESDYNQDVSVAGVASVNTQFNVRITAQNELARTQDVRLTGRSTSASSTDARIVSFNTTSVSSTAKIVGQKDLSSTYDVRVVAQKVSLLETDVRLVGQAVDSFARDVSVIAEQTTSLEQFGATVGQASSSSSYDVRVSPQDGVSIVYTAKLIGESNIDISHDVRTIGSIQTGTSDDRSVRFDASTTAAATYATTLLAHENSFTERAAQVTGQAVTLSERDVAIQAQSHEDSAYSIRLAGAQVVWSSFLSTIIGQSTLQHDIETAIVGEEELFQAYQVAVHGTGGFGAPFDVVVIGVSGSQMDQTVAVTGTARYIGRGAAGASIKRRPDEARLVDRPQISQLAKVRWTE